MAAPTDRRLGWLHQPSFKAGQSDMQDAGLVEPTQPTSWTPPPSLPLPSQGEGPKLAASAAPARAVPRLASWRDRRTRQPDARRPPPALPPARPRRAGTALRARSEEHTSELQSLMRSSYAAFCLKKKNIIKV